VRVSAANALGNTVNSLEAVTALLVALKDENKEVRASAARAFRQITKQLTIETISYLPEKLIVALSLPGLDSYIAGGKAYDSIFDSLNALAPFPKA